MATANMIAQSNATSLPTSSVEFAAMPATWHETARIDNVVPIGVTVPKVLTVHLVAVQLLDVSAVVTLSIVNTR